MNSLIYNNKEMGKKILIFTDLDGTLLDYHTYSYEKALPALRYIRKKEIPLIICTSKTRAEIEAYQKKLKNRHPFISENGGAIFIPQHYFKKMPASLRKRNGYVIKELGTPYQVLRGKLKDIAGRFNQDVKGFGDMKAQEIHSKYGVPLREARLSKKREYDEPFNFVALPDEKIVRDMVKEFAKGGLHMVKGGRLFHLMGNNDKGKAARWMKKIYEKVWKKKVVTVGIGDSLNDLPLLLEVDLPVVVKLTTGIYEEEIVKQLKGPLLTGGIGPEGWNEAVLQILRRMGGDT
ncbi:MAG: HAD-IIB family hydrolase [Deltaproteobacteria bacterium]|nr:HAD-IIB family hydrolase [Deltaproteobacteria bacterium]